MGIKNTALSFLISLLLVLFAYAYAGAFQAKLLPSQINPGDAFVIKVSGVKTSELPAVFFKKTQIYFTTCGESCFIAVGAVERETKPGVYKIRLHIGEKRMNLRLVVKHTIFPTRFLTLPEEKVFLSPEDLKRAEREEERLKLLWQMVTERLWEGSFILPLENTISTPFGTKRIINRKKVSIHRGMDIKGKEGEEVKASNSGRVVLAEELFFGGNTVILDHGQGIFTMYMHLSSFNVKPEDIVSKGDIVGFVGSSGRSSGSHLHFGVMVQDISTNPVSFVKLKL